MAYVYVTFGGFCLCDIRVTSVYMTLGGFCLRDAWCIVKPGLAVLDV